MSVVFSRIGATCERERMPLFICNEWRFPRRSRAQRPCADGVRIAAAFARHIGVGAAERAACTSNQWGTPTLNDALSCASSCAMSPVSQARYCFIASRLPAWRSCTKKR